MSVGTDPRALRELIREAAEDSQPQLPWDRMEARLFAELDDLPGPVRGMAPGEDDLEPVASQTIAVEDAPRPSVFPEIGIPAEHKVIPAVASTREVALSEIAPAPDSLSDRLSVVPASRGSRWARWVGALAVAAALGGLWISHGRSPVESTAPVAVAEPIDPNDVPLAPGMSGVHDLNALKAGDIVEAAVGPLEFGELGSMEWTLSAGGRLVVLEGLQSGTHVVELQSGSMRGSVAPGASTPLVISAGETEVVSLGAGSIFSVTRSSRRVVMHLEEGSASVGQRGHRADGRVFEAPLMAAFSLDGGSDFEMLPMPKLAVEVAPSDAAKTASTDPVDGPTTNDVHAPSDRPVARVDHDRSVAKKEEPIALKQAPDSKAEPGVVDPKSEVRLSDSALSSTLVSCIARLRNDRQAKAADGVSILVNSVLSIQVNDDGSVKGAVFNPPLERELQGCAVFVLRSKLQTGARTVSVPISLP